jgi:hypothetical protein
MGSLLVGFALLWAVAALWTVLGRCALGRALQLLITAVVYGAWLSLIPLGIYFIGKDIAETLAENSYGKAIFIGVISLTLIPFFILALIPWNGFCGYAWRKVGIKLPQLGGGAEYHNWQRER